MCGGIGKVREMGRPMRSSHPALNFSDYLTSVSLIYEAKTFMGPNVHFYFFWEKFTAATKRQISQSRGVRNGWFLIIGLLLSSFDTSAWAAPVTYRYTGVAGPMLSGIWLGQGTAVSGTFTFDSTLVDTYPNDPTIDDYTWNDLANIPLASVFEMTISLGSIFRTTNNHGNPLGPEFFGLTLGDTSFYDYFQFYVHGANGDAGSLLVWDITSLSPDGVSPGYGNLGSKIEDTMKRLQTLDINSFDYPTDQSYWFARDPNTSQFVGSLNFTLTSISPVPLPSSVLLFVTGIMFFYLLKKRMSASLLSFRARLPP